MWQLARKLLLTGVFSFVAPGSYAQLYFGMVLSLGSLVVLSIFTPYVDPALDVLQCTCQVSCVVTLLCAINLKAVGDGNEPIFLNIVNILSVAFQIIPFATVLCVMLYVTSDVGARAHAAMLHAKSLPAVLRDEDPNPLPPARRRRWARPAATTRPVTSTVPAVGVTPDTKSGGGPHKVQDLPDESDMCV